MDSLQRATEVAEECQSPSVPEEPRTKKPRPLRSWRERVPLRAASVLLEPKHQWKANSVLLVLVMLMVLTLLSVLVRMLLMMLVAMLLGHFVETRRIASSYPHASCHPHHQTRKSCWS